MRYYTFTTLLTFVGLTSLLVPIHAQPTTTVSNSTDSVTRQVLQAIPIQALPGYESRLVRLEFGPGTKVPVHNHPVPGTGYVISGDLLSQFEGGEVEIHHEGEAFFELGIVPHVRVENINPDKSLVIIMNYVIKIGEANVKTLVDNEPGGV